MRNFMRLFGSTMALAVCASIINNTLRSAIHPLGLSGAQISALVNDPTIINNPSQIDLSAEQKAVIIAGYLKGFHNVFYLTIASSVTAFLTSVFCIEQLELNRADDQELKRQGKEFLERKKMEKRGQTDRKGGEVATERDTDLDLEAGEKAVIGLIEGAASDAKS